MYFNFTPISDLKDENLVPLVQARDETAFKELMDRYNPKIWFVVNENSRQRQDAEEILMDIWMAVWDNIIGLRKPESFGGWLRRIAHNACKRYYASGKNQHSEILLDYDELTLQIDREAEQRFQNARLRSDAREAVHQLPQRIVSVARLYYLEQWNVNEIATELNLAVGTVKSKLSEVRKLLRKEFEVEPIRRETMSANMQNNENEQKKIKIIGVGGAGCNTLKRLIDESWRNTEFYVVDTDKETLSSCNEVTQVQIGINNLKGQSTNGNLELGKRAAAESMEELRAIVSDASLVFVIAGMGGGTGTAVAPVITSLARQQKALTICMATRPFEVEGKLRSEQAEEGIRELHSNEHPQADAVIIVPNQRILDLVDVDLPIPQAFLESDEILVQGVSLIAEMVTYNGEINVDLEDIQSMLQNKGTVLMSFGKAKGENRAGIAARNAISSPLFEESKVNEESAVIVGIASPPDFTMHDLDAVMKEIVKETPHDQCMFGLVYKKELEATGEVIVTIIATMPDSSKQQVLTIDTSKDTEAPTDDKTVSASKTQEFTHQPKYSNFDLSYLINQVPVNVQTTIEQGITATVKNQLQSEKIHS